eukprot:COSAG06_NODE_63118_length_263_cov_0.628049_1_plen_40_part_10
MRCLPSLPLPLSRANRRLPSPKCSALGGSRVCREADRLLL